MTPANGEEQAAAGFLFERALAAYVLLAVTLWANDGALGVGAVGPFLGCIYLLWDTGRGLKRAAAPPGATAALSPAQWAKYLGLLALLSGGRRPGFYLRPGTPLWPFTLLSAILLVLALIGVRRGLRRTQRDALAMAMLVTAGAAGVLLLRASPSPHIDVFTIQQLGAAHLLAGTDPYAVSYPNLYGASESLTYFGAAQTTLRCYPYPPLSLLFATAGFWLGGDVRVAFLALQLLTGLLLYAMVRRRAGATALGLCALHLLNPRGLFLLEQAWTEPLLMAGVTIWTALLLGAPRASRRAELLQGLGLGLLLAAKQYAVLLLPLALAPRLRPGWPRAARLRSAGIAVGLCGLGVLPFLLWHPRALIEDLVLFQLRQPFRPDALTLPALAHVVTGLRAPGALAILGAAVSFFWILPRLPQKPAGVLFGAAVGCFAFFATAKQAFCNYYSLVAVLLLCTAAAAAAAPDSADTAR